MKLSCRSTSRLAGTLVAIFMAVACDTPFGIRESGGVTVDARDQRVIVTNKSQSAIVEDVVGVSILPLYDPAGCTNTAHCKPLFPGESRSRPFSQIAMGPNERAVRVNWRYVTIDAAGDLHGSQYDGVTVPLAP